MKKFIFVLPLLLSCEGLLLGQQVSLNDAVIVAVNELNGLYPDSSFNVTNVVQYERKGNTLMYEVMTSYGISVLVSGHYDCRPILATIDNGNQSVINNYDGIPCGLQFMMDWYLAQLDSCFSRGGSDSSYRGCWKSLLVSEPLYSYSDFVLPLIQTRWRQSQSNDDLDKYAYNYYIPNTWYMSDDCKHPKAGCGAVAMGQVMKYYNYPVFSPERIQQYDWCNMSNKLLLTSANYDKERDAIARLLADCAEDVTIPFGFGCNETSSILPNIEDALVDNYRYSDTMELIRQGNHSIGWWTGELKRELQRGHPILYGGSKNFWGSGGHIFICDGYDRSGRFHFNWGWGDNFLNVYCEVNNIYNSNQNDPYDSWLYALFYVYPKTEQDLCNIHLSLENYYSGLSNFLNLFPIYEFTPQTMTTLTSASVSSPASWRTIPANATAVYQAHEEINLRDGFEAEYGSEFEARIEPCGLCDEMRGTTAGERTVPGNDGQGQGGETDYLPSPRRSAVDIDLYPNPTDGPLTMAVDGEVREVLVSTLDGRPVGGWHLTALTETAVNFDVSPLAPGVYLLTVATSAGIHTARFIKQ